MVVRWFKPDRSIDLIAHMGYPFLIETISKMFLWSPAFGGIGASFQILEILEYACYRSDCCAVGLKLGTAAILVRLRRI